MTQKQTQNKKKEEFVCVPKKQAASGQNQQQQQKNIQHKIKYNIFRSAENMCILAIYVICVDIYIYISRVPLGLIVDSEKNSQYC